MRVQDYGCVRSGGVRVGGPDVDTQVDKALSGIKNITILAETVSELRFLCFFPLFSSLMT
jgi:hypothetical protein